KIPVWASPNNLTSGTLVINELVALDLTTCEIVLILKMLEKPHFQHEKLKQRYFPSPIFPFLFK
ncbi:hypothetical protein RFK25_10490, partial [Streptococcus sp. SS-4456]